VSRSGFRVLHVAGIVLLTICLAVDVLATCDDPMGEFAGFRRPLLIAAAAIGYVLALRFVRRKFLAVRALWRFFACLAAEPPARWRPFLRYETSRLLASGYCLICYRAGLFLGGDPYVLSQSKLSGRRGAYSAGASCTLLRSNSWLCVILAFAFTHY